MLTFSTFCWHFPHFCWHFQHFSGNARFWYHLVISMWVVVCAGQRRFWTRKAIWTRIAKKHPSRMRMPLCAWYQVHTFILILFGLKLILKIYLAWCKQEILSGSDLTVSYFWPVMFPSSHNLQKGRIVRSYDRRWWNWIRVLFARGRLVDSEDFQQLSQPEEG